MGQPTMQQVAERAGVSTALVSLVMRGAPNVSDHRRARVLDAARQLGYRPNVLARNLASRRTNVLGVVLNDLHNPFFAEAIDGIQSQVDAAGYRLLIGNGQRSPAGEAQAVETFLEYRVDGLVLVGPQVSTAVINSAAASTPVVAVGRTVRSRRIDTVNNDEAVGAQLAVDHLVALGHRRIAHIHGGTGAGARARRRGYEATMAAHGLGRYIEVEAADFSEPGGFDAARRLLARARPPTAIFAANDQSAAGALDLLVSEGLDVPGDVSIVGYDNTALAAMHHMSLTTIDQPRSELGRIATDLVFERIDGTRDDAVHHVVAPTLVERATSAPPSSKEDE